jgi:hypothetical protein
MPSKGTQTRTIRANRDDPILPSGVGLSAYLHRHRRMHQRANRALRNLRAVLHQRIEEDTTRQRDLHALGGNSLDRRALAQGTACTHGYGAALWPASLPTFGTTPGPACASPAQPQQRVRAEGVCVHIFTYRSLLAHPQGCYASP